MSRKNRRPHKQVSKKKFLSILNKHTSKKLTFPEVQELYDIIDQTKRGECDGMEWARKANPENLALAAGILDLDIDIPGKVGVLFFNDHFGEEVRNSFGDDDAIFSGGPDCFTPTVAAKSYGYGWTVAAQNFYLEASSKVTPSKK